MAERERPTTTCGGCWPSKREAFQIGLTLGHSLATAEFHKMQQPKSGLLSQIKEGLNLLGLLYKAWPLLSWTTTLGCFGWFAKMLTRLFAG